jgi:MscS family membrane protein
MVEDKILLDINSSQQTDFINSFDMDVPNIVQSALNHLYIGADSEFWSYLIFGTPLANISGAIFILLFFLFLRKMFTKFMIRMMLFVALQTKNVLDERIITGLKEPIRFGFIIVGLHLFFMILFVDNEFIHLILESLIIYTIFWGIISFIDALKDYLFNYRDMDKIHSKELSSFVIKVLKTIVVAIGATLILQNWGVNVTGITTSLGIGGLAFALAAKDSASNLVASIALLLDNSIKNGEWVKVAGVEGVVESVDMRTTKIRSFQKSIFTIPNSLVANNPIENFSRRGVRRIKMSIGLTYRTTATDVENIVIAIRYLLQHHPRISQKETLLVNFNDFGDSSLDIFIYTFTNTANWEQYLSVREDIHLKILKIVEENNSSFAFPSQSIYLEDNK